MYQATWSLSRDSWHSIMLTVEPLVTSHFQFFTQSEKKRQCTTRTLSK